MASSPRWQRWAIGSGALAVAAFLLYRFDPTVVRFFPICVFHALTGLECPGCGATRAMHRLLHGDLAGAFRFNQLIFAVPPFLLAAWRWPRFTKRPDVAWTTVTVVVVYAIVRNLPFWPYPL